MRFKCFYSLMCCRRRWIGWLVFVDKSRCRGSVGMWWSTCAAQFYCCVLSTLSAFAWPCLSPCAAWLEYRLTICRWVFCCGSPWLTSELLIHLIIVCISRLTRLALHYKWIATRHCPCLIRNGDEVRISSDFRRSTEGFPSKRSFFTSHSCSYLQKN